MVDTNQCKMVYDGAEEEYEDFYDYSKALADGEGSLMFFASLNINALQHLAAKRVIFGVWARVQRFFQHTEASLKALPKEACVSTSRQRYKRV